MKTRARMVAVAVLLGALAAPASAQPLARQAAGAPRVAVVAAPSGARSFAIEAAGGVAGSMLGFGTMYLAADRCDVEDLACTLESVFAGMVVGTVASAAGTYLAGRAGDTEPSLAGAGIGAVLGAGAGVGLWHLFTEELDVGNHAVSAALTYTVAQGVTSALGSRLLRRLR